jgi:hypothetical protein
MSCLRARVWLGMLATPCISFLLNENKAVSARLLSIHKNSYAHDIALIK